MGRRSGRGGQRHVGDGVRTLWAGITVGSWEAWEREHARGGRGGRRGRSGLTGAVVVVDGSEHLSAVGEVGGRPMLDVYAVISRFTRGPGPVILVGIWRVRLGLMSVRGVALRVRGA